MWRNLTTAEDLKHMLFNDQTLKTRSIMSTPLKPYVSQIREAFEKKTSGEWLHTGIQRDMSIETRYDADTDNFRAWFSSEYAGCGNGDYYIMINPTVAVFVETD